MFVAGLRKTLLDLPGGFEIWFRSGAARSGSDRGAGKPCTAVRKTGRLPHGAALLLSLALLAGCAHAPKRVVTEERANHQRPVNPVALHHVFRGALYETLGDPRSALIEYQEALLYDSSASSIYQAAGENYLRLRKFGSAVKMLEKAVQLDSTNTEALRLLADLYQRSGNYSQMEQVLRRLLVLEPEDPDILSNLVALLVSRGRAEEALDIVEKVAAERPMGVEELLGLAQVFAKQGANDQARSIAEQAIRQEPDDERAYMMLADLYIEAGDTSGAQAFLERTVEQHPQFDQVRRRLHDVYVMQGDWASAIELLEQEVKRDSNDVGLWLQLGRLYVQRGDTSAAEQLFLDLTRRFPKEPSTYVSLAAVHLARGDTGLAIEDLRKGLESQWNGDLVERAKDLLVRQGRTDEAIELVRLWVQKDSSSISARLQLADLYLTAGDTTEADRVLRGVIHEFPKDWRGYFALGRLLYLRSKLDECQKYLATARQLEEEFVGSWILSGLAYLRQDSLERAELIFREAADRFPRDPQVNFLLGNTLSRARRYEEAIPFLERAHKLSPEDVDIMLGLAAAYDELEKYERSDSLYRQVLKIAPTHPTALNNYAYSLSVRGERLDEAYEMARKALEADPDNGAFLDTMGWILYKMGKYGEALDYIRQAAELRKDSADVFEHLGDVYEALGDLEQARQAWERALELDSSRKYLSQKIEAR